MKFPLFFHVHRAVAVLALAASFAVAAQPVRDWHVLVNEMVDQEIVAAGVKNERVIRATANAAARICRRQPSRPGVLGYGAADWQFANDLAAICRGLDDRGHRSAADR